METATHSCPLCGRDAENKTTSQEWDRDVLAVRCDACGEFSISLEARNRLPSLHSESWKLSCMTKERTLHYSGESPFCIVSTKDAAGKVPGGVTIDDLLAAFPRSVAKRLDRALVNISQIAGDVGQLVELSTPLASATLFAKDDRSMSWTLDALVHGDWLRRSPPSKFSITPQGYRRLDELVSGHPVRKRSQAFVAMAFKNEHREARQGGLKEGIEAAGYEPYIVDRDEFLGKVDDRIVAEIRQSWLMVADLSFSRPNVYFEVGLAEGLGIPVVLTFHDRENRLADDEPQFDKRQDNIIFWKTKEELAERVQRRIEAVIGRPS